jgi:predicted secreted protein
MPTLLPFEKSPKDLPLVLLGTFFLLAGCGLFRPNVDKKTSAAQPLAIVLPANFSTGYRWVLDPPLQAAHLLNESYSSPSLPGAPGQQTLRVVFPREGRFTLRFSYRRLWESSSVPPAQTTNFVVQVLPGHKNPSIMEQLFAPQSSDSQIPQPEEEAPMPSTNRIQLRRP